MSDRFAGVGEFAVPFAYAVHALRRASDAGEGCTLTAEQVKALVDALRMLSTNAKGES